MLNFNSPTSAANKGTPMPTPHSSSPKADFERLLKESDYLNSIIQAHRSATERIITALIQELAGTDPERFAAALKALKKAEQTTLEPSVDTEIRRMARGIRDRVQSNK